MSDAQLPKLLQVLLIEDSGDDAYFVQAMLAEGGQGQFELTHAPLISEAWEILNETVLPLMDVVGLTSKEYAEVVRESARNGLAGGMIYDAIHLHCARKARCDRIYTFDVPHFQRIAPDLHSRISAP